jgi:hypothetical protein
VKGTSDAMVGHVFLHLNLQSCRYVTRRAEVKVRRKVIHVTGCGGL